MAIKLKLIFLVDKQEKSRNQDSTYKVSLTSKINNTKFAHQSFCNPPIASLLKAINACFLNGAPHLDTHTVRKYLLASPATAKGQVNNHAKGFGE